MTKFIMFVFVIAFIFNTQIIDARAPSLEEIPAPTIEDIIEFYAHQYGLNASVMKEIAYAESKYQNVWNYLYETNPTKYTAFGIFQILESTYKHFCGDPEERFDEIKNIECAMIIASESGLHHWNESRSQWEG